MLYVIDIKKKHLFYIIYIHSSITHIEKNPHLPSLKATDPADIQTSIEKLRALRFEAKGQLQRHCGASAICATGKGWGWDFA
jgi:hypothetical protein